MSNKSAATQDKITNDPKNTPKYPILRNILVTKQSDDKEESGNDEESDDEKDKALHEKPAANIGCMGFCYSTE